MKGWTRGNTKIGPVLDVAVSYHRGRYEVEIMINSLFGGGTRSWVRIVKGINKYVTEMSEETHIKDIGESTEKPVAKARPKQTPSSMLSSSTIPVPCHERTWIDVEPGRFDKSCLEVSKLMIRLLRHDDTVHRDDDGVVKFQDLASIFCSEFTSSSHRSIRTWLSLLQRGGGIKKRFQYCVDPSSPETLLYLRTIQGHSGGKHLDPRLQDNVLLPDDFAEHIYHVGSSQDSHSIIQSGLKKGRRAVFFTAVNPLFDDQHKRSRVRPDEAQNCSLQKQLESTPKYIFGVI